jgi:esterase
MHPQSLNYKMYGSPSTHALVVVHGLFGSLDNWMTLAKLWSEHFFVIAIDVRNHGRSFHSLDMRFESLSKDILDVLHIEKIEICDLLGHSMGGKIAMDFAYRYPEMLRKLVIVDVAPYRYEAHHHEVFYMLEQVIPSSYASRLDIENEIKKYIASEGVAQFMGKNIRRNETSLAFEWKFNLEVLKKEYQTLIQYIPHQGFDGEVLFVGGENSAYISVEKSENIARLYPKYELTYIANAGHWVHADNPREFYATIMQFLN